MNKARSASITGAAPGLQDGLTDARAAGPEGRAGLRFSGVRPAVRKADGQSDHSEAHAVIAEMDRGPDVRTCRSVSAQAGAGTTPRFAAECSPRG